MNDVPQPSSAPARHSVLAVPYQVTLANCDREPIHIPGSIQPHGALLAFEPGSGTVLHVSTNLPAWFAQQTLPARGRSVAALLGEAAWAGILQALAATASGGARHHVVDLPARPAQGQAIAFEAVVHAHRGVGMAELEPSAAPGGQPDWMQKIGDTIEALRGADDLDDLVARIAQRVKRLTHFDRVMVYRFDEDWNGHVIADAREADMASFFDLHYPASDIPAQARELFHRNLVRHIAAVAYDPVPVLPWLDSDRQQPLDMSHATLRSASPIHLTYLGNMGVGASLTLSILVDERLWGLVACHHRAPRRLPVRLRHACHALAVTTGYMVGWQLQRERAAATASLAHARARIVEAFNHVQAPLADAIEQGAAPLQRIAGATGGAFWRDGVILPFGQWPDGAAGDAVVRFARDALETSTDDVTCTERMAPESDPAAAAPRAACGALAVRLDAFAASGIVWVRPEIRREVAWGGDPDKPVQVQSGPDGAPVLSPRTSFARWVTLVRGHCRPWTDLDLEAARSLLPLRQVLTVRDSLAQVSLSDRRFRSLVALQSDAYCELDVDGRVVTLSRPLPTGHGPVEGLALVSLFATACGAPEAAALARALRSGAPFRDLRLHGQPARDRAEFVVELGGEPMVDPHGRITGWHGTITDTTYQVAIQAALRQKEAAEISSLAKSRFLAQISHELRTPLNAVLGFVQLLLMDDGISATQRDRLQYIRRAGDWLLEMISDLMDLSQIETGHLPLKMGTVDARAVIAETIALVDAQAIATEVRLLGAPGGPPVWVLADPSRLRQVLVNLTSNALKYNRILGEVRLEVQPDAVAGRTRIAVCDTGVGMTPAQIGQLFEPFNRLGREFLGIQGTGIGLVIARQLIEAMGGGISVESEVGLGSTFAVTLANAVPAAPLAPPPPAGRVSTAAREAAPERAVLYVGDDASNVVLVQSIVEELPGCRLVQVDSAERGFELTRELAPAVVLIDIRHSGQPGMRLLRSIKADPATRHIRCIAVNASAMCETLEELQGAGFEDRWAKPIDLKVISAGLKAALSR